MKKLLIALILILTLALSGCEEETAQPIYYNYEFEGKLMIGCTDTTGDIAQTQLEIRTLVIVILRYTPKKK